jgi:Zn-dependent peptidase ImmA (M78 family)
MDIAAIRQTLNKALLQLNPDGTWPVNLNGIVSRLGIGLRYEKQKVKTSSYLQLEDVPTIIIYRQNLSLLLSARERFSIAHELAHWIVWRRFGFLPSSETYWEHETICNEFAAGLLVPPHALKRFLEKQYGENVDPVYFPDKVKLSAAVSWDVAAKSITATHSADSAYLRFIKVSNANSKKGAASKQQVALKVNCSTLTNMPGSFVGLSSLLSDQDELFEWMNDLSNRKVERRHLTRIIGSLRLTNVLCTFLREPNYWVIHFRPSSEGVQIKPSSQVAQNNKAGKRVENHN